MFLWRQLQATGPFCHPIGCNKLLCTTSAPSIQTYTQDTKENPKEIRRAKRREYSRRYELKNKEKRKLHNSRYRVLNKEKLRLYHREYENRNKEKRSGYNKRYEMLNKEKRSHYKTPSKGAKREYDRLYEKREKRREYKKQYERREDRKLYRKRKREEQQTLHESRKKYSWKSTEDVRENLEALSKKLHVRNMDDWYRVGTAQLLEIGGGRVLSKFGNTFKALKYAYPEIDWVESRFSLKGKKSTQRQLHVNAATIFPDETKILEQ